MNTLVNVARYHLVDRFQYTALPIGVTAFAFAVNLVIFALAPTPAAGNYTGALLTLYVFLLVLGVLSVSRSLPFGFALGLSRRTYYLGTMAFVCGLALAYGLLITALQAAERATGGWGSMRIHFFRVPWILDGPWYLTWFTAFVVLVLMFSYGMWYGLVYRRWNITGTVIFAAGQALVALAAVAGITRTHSWPAIAHFFSGLDAAAFTGILAAATAALALGGYTTIRRVTV